VQINEIASRTYPTSALFEPDHGSIVYQYYCPWLFKCCI